MASHGFLFNSRYLVVMQNQIKNNDNEVRFDEVRNKCNVESKYLVSTPYLFSAWLTK